MTTEADCSLIRAYGRHWLRSEVNWGSGGDWQMLGRLNTNRPGLRICDFRLAHGVYVLEGRSGPQYVGISRGSHGIGARLAAHHRDPRKGKWTRFSWFTLDVVEMEGTRDDPLPQGWAWLYERPLIDASNPRERIEELEALLVGLLGLRLTNERTPQFRAAKEWKQVVRSNFGPGGMCHRVDRAPFKQQLWH